MTPSEAYERPTNAPSCLHGEPPAGERSVVRQYLANHPQGVRHASGQSSVRARDKGIRDKDKRRSVRTLYDGIDVPYLLEELLVRYDVAFARTPVSERCVFCNAVYLGDTQIQLHVGGYALSNHVWLVDFLRANNIDFSDPVEGLLTIWSRKWRNAGLGDPRTAFAGLCAVNADKRRNILAIECNLEARL